MQQSLGEIIRQVRRMRNLTQRELAGERYSKSYVSGIEHNRISPSAEVLRYFAVRLGQPDGIFASLLQQPDVEKALIALSTPLPAGNGHDGGQTTAALLLTLMEQADLPDSLPLRHLPTLNANELASLPPHLRAHYFFMTGQEARKRGELPDALRALESALALASGEQQAFILDEIGTCYFTQRDFVTALGYHLHALRLPLKAPFEKKAMAFKVKIELHCGDDYAALAAYQEALEHYMSAHANLAARNDLATTAQVYSGLGYLLYTQLSTSASLSAASALFLSLTEEDIESHFQRAASFLQQGLSLYQASSQRLEETVTRLTLAELQIDWSQWRLTLAARAAGSEMDPSTLKQLADHTPLLDSAEEHCRQVLLAWHVQDQAGANTGTELNALLYTALAYLVRIATQRAARARLESIYLDSAYRQRAFAAHLCQLLLDARASASPPSTVIQQFLTLTSENLAYRAPSLPHYKEMLASGNDSSNTEYPPADGLSSVVEVYTAAGELAEELGRVANTPSYARDCYTQASQFLQSALSLAYERQVKGAGDPASLPRLYRRCIALLEARLVASPRMAEETSQELLHLLQQAFWQLQRPPVWNAGTGIEVVEVDVTGSSTPD